MNIVWFRRNLRLDDNLPLQMAISKEKSIIPIFIFDTNILARFNNTQDRRVSFIASAIFNMHRKLQALNSAMTILYGKPEIVLPKFIAELKMRNINVENVYADEDFEPANIIRDKQVADSIDVKLHLVCDHLLVRPGSILSSQGAYFKVFTPFSKVIKQHLAGMRFPIENNYLNKITFYTPNLAAPYIAKFASISELVEFIGYSYFKDDLWDVEHVKQKLLNFVATKILNYKQQRDFMGNDSTSSLSPYIRFGLISIRECFLQAYDQAGSDMWINELLWREFYANILFAFPHTVDTELNSHYVGKIPWRKDPNLLQILEEGNTGFPIVDAAMRQLVKDGWMHNRSRMIVASFATKNMLLDWRLGESLFAKYLMDYDLASNVGGWQWASSCGTDSQPYFRIFNPTLQSLKFDSDGRYIKKYLPELQEVANEHIHEHALIKQFYPHLNYSKPCLDYKASRDFALQIFSIKN